MSQIFFHFEKNVKKTIFFIMRKSIFSQIFVKVFSSQFYFILYILHLISLNLADSLGGVVALRVVLPLVVDQHLDQLVVHDLHVHLQQGHIIVCPIPFSQVPKLYQYLYPRSLSCTLFHSPRSLSCSLFHSPRSL